MSISFGRYVSIADAECYMYSQALEQNDHREANLPSNLGLEFAPFTDVADFGRVQKGALFNTDMTKGVSNSSILRDKWRDSIAVKCTLGHSPPGRVKTERTGGRLNLFSRYLAAAISGKKTKPFKRYVTRELTL